MGTSSENLSHWTSVCWFLYHVRYSNISFPSAGEVAKAIRDWHVSDREALAGQNTLQTAPALAAQCQGACREWERTRSLGLCLNHCFNFLLDFTTPGPIPMPWVVVLPCSKQSCSQALCFSFSGWKEKSTAWQEWTVGLKAMPHIFWRTSSGMNCNARSRISSWKDREDEWLSIWMTKRSMILLDKIKNVLKGNFFWYFSLGLMLSIEETSTISRFFHSLSIHIPMASLEGIELWMGQIPEAGYWLAPALLVPKSKGISLPICCFCLYCSVHKWNHSFHQAGGHMVTRPYWSLL